ncbi:MAG TPA: hypothetical protein VKB47_08735 [Terracidiphilus sp.]|nr:hypothetical protein [Terracidiphilus sp.]
MQRAKSIAQIALIVIACGLGLALTRAVWTSTPAAVADLEKTGQALDATTRAAGDLQTAADKVSAIADENRPKIAQMLDNANGATANLRQASHGLTIAIAEINRPCSEHAPCGMIADIDRTLATFRGAAGQVEIAARHENKRLDVVDGQEQQLADDTHEAIGKLDGAIDQINGTAKSIGDLAGNKDLAASLTQLNSIFKSGAGMAKEAEQAVHNFFHPKWPARVYGQVKSIGLTAARWFVQ